MAVSMTVDGLDACKKRFKEMLERAKKPDEVMKSLKVQIDKT